MMRRSFLEKNPYLAKLERVAMRKVKLKMKHSRMSVVATARASGVPRITLRRMMDGTTRIRLSEFISLCSALTMDPMEVLIESRKSMFAKKVRSPPR